MRTHLTAVMAPVALSTQGLVNYLHGLFGPLFLGIVAIFFPAHPRDHPVRAVHRARRGHRGHLLHARHRARAGHWHSERARSPLIMNQKKKRTAVYLDSLKNKESL
jgi:hypothetical protein